MQPATNHAAFELLQGCVMGEAPPAPSLEIPSVHAVTVKEVGEVGGFRSDSDGDSDSEALTCNVHDLSVTEAALA